MVTTVDTQCHSLGSPKGSDRPTQTKIKERSVAKSDEFGIVTISDYSRSDGVHHATLQDRLLGELTHLRHHEGSNLASPTHQ